MPEYNTMYYDRNADKNKYLYFNYLTCNDNVATAGHIHDSIEFVFVTKGVCNIYINGEKICLSEGDAAFIDRFDVHYYEYVEGGEYYVFLISRECLNSTNEFDKYALNTYLPRSEKYPEIKKLFDSAYALWDKSNKALCEGFANMVLGIMAYQYPLIKREDKGDVKALVNALIYINENFAEEITLDFLSSKFAYSKNYFSALFNRFVNMNLREYINRRRICEFDRIKAQDNKTPTYIIAQCCGFNNMKTFYRAYEKYGANKNKS